MLDQSKGLQSVRKLPILKHLGIAHKILRYKVKEKKKNHKKITKCRKNNLALEAEKKRPKRKNKKTKKR